MMSFKRNLFLLGIAWALGCAPSGAATFTWVGGSAGNDWFNTNNWTPVGVPGSNDTVNVNAGTINFTAPVTINNQLNWGGGVFGGSALTIATNGVLNITGSAGKSFYNTLTNLGTVNWMGSGPLSAYNNNSPSYSGAIWNLPGGIFNVGTDENINYDGGYEFFNNQGLFEKTAGTGTTYEGINFTNTGTVLVLEGTLNFSGGGSIGGFYTNVAGANLNFTAGNFTAASATISGSAVAFTGGSLILLTDVIPGLSLTGGTVNLAATFQGGAITNLTLAGSTLAGAHTVTGTLSCGGGFAGPLSISAGGTMNWLAGNASGSLTVASNALLNISGSGGKNLYNALTNQGTVLWTGSGAIGLYNNASPTYAGAIWNLPGGIFNIATDQNLNYQGGYEFFNNQGTLEKTSGTGTTFIGLVTTNSGTVSAAEGTLNFSGGGSIGGAYSVALGTAINFYGGSFVAFSAVISGPGTVAQTGGTLTLLNDVIPGLQTVGGSVVLAPSFQNGTITNLTLIGSVLAGTNVTTGTVSLGGGFNGPLALAPGATMSWSGGNAFGSLNVASNAVLNIVGTSTHNLYCPLTNGGTITFTAAVAVGFYNNGTPTYSGAVYNLPGALFNIATDQNLNYGGGSEFFNNQGTLEKTAGTGTTYIGLVFTNSGTVSALSGTLIFNNGGVLGGSYNASAGAAINFNNGTFSANSPVMTGTGTITLTGGSLTLLSSPVPNLILGGGTVNLGAGFEGGAITNLSLAGGTLLGTNTLTGTMIWSGGNLNGSLTVASNAVLNIIGTATKYLNADLTNWGTVTWSGAGPLTIENNQSSLLGQIWNTPSGIFNIATDQNINCACYGNEFINNQGTLEKTAGTGSTYINVTVTNTGTVTALSGTLNMNAGGFVGGNYTAATNAAINFLGGNFIAGLPNLLGPVAFTGGSLTLLTNAIPDLALNAGTLTLGSLFEGGTITNLTLSGSTLIGTNTVAGVFNWTGGSILGPVTVLTGATLNISGANPKYLQAALTNWGTTLWTGSGALGIYNNASSLLGQIWNMPGGVFNIATDENINCACYGNEFINNQGLLEKTAGTGSTYISVLVTNTGTVETLSGTLNFNSGGDLGGTYTALAGTAINFDNGPFTAGSPVVNGAGPVSFTGGTMTLITSVVTNLGLISGTVNVAPSFEGGSITNLTIGGSTFVGTNIVTGTLVWTAGTLAGPLTVSPTGALVVSGGTFKSLQAPLTNFGTVTWTGQGNLGIYNNGSSLRGSIWNQAGGLFQIENDQVISCACYGLESFNNQGTVEKLIATGTTTIQVPFTNNGTLNMQSGLVNFAASTPYVEAGETLDFGISGTNGNNGRAELSGNISFDGTLGVNFVNGFIPTVGAQFTLFNYTTHAGFFTSLNLPALPGGERWAVSAMSVNLVLQVVAAGTADNLLVSGSVTATNGTPIVGATVYAFIATNTFTNLIVNGSFETPNIGSTLYQRYPSGSTNLPGWTVVGPANDNIDLVSYSGGPAEDGNQYFDPTGATGGAGLAQTFPTVSGQTYALSFYHGTESVYNRTNVLGVTLGTNYTVYGETPGGYGNLAWKYELVPFVAVSNFTTLTFSELTGFDANDSYVDNVQVTPVDYGVVLEALTDANGHYQIPVASGTFQVSVSGLPALGYNNVAAQTTVVATANQTVNFSAVPLTGAQLFTITTIANPAGAGTTSGGGTLGAGAIATVSAAPITTTLPYLFANWTENGVFQSATNNYSFPVIRNRSLVANFTLPIFNITASNNPANGGVINGAGSYFYGVTNLLTTTPNFGFIFTNWTEGATIVGTSPTLTTVVFTNHAFIANYIDANLNHVVTTVTAPVGLATVAGAGIYTNGQTAFFTTPLFVTNSPFFYIFQQFTLSNSVVATTNTFTKTFSTLDATNLQYVAVYKTMTILPLLTNVTANYANPVPATTNFLLTLQFDRSMKTNGPPVVVLTNVAVSLQPVVAANGSWTATFISNDTYHVPPVTLSPGMDGTVQLLVSGVLDLNGDLLTPTNATTFTVQATPPTAPVLSLVASNSSSVTVAWSGYAASPNLAGFRLYIENTNFTSLAAVPVYTSLGSSSRSYTFGGLTLNTNYFLAVQAVDNVGNALSTVSAFPVYLPSTVPPPVTIQVAAAGGSSALVSWNGYSTAALLGFTGFQVYYQTTNFTSVAGLTPQATLTAVQTSLQVNGLDRTKTTWFAVVGYNNTNGFNPGVTTARWTDPYAGTIGVTTTIGGAAPSVVNIYQSITVVSNAALVVLPGTTLLFAPGTSLTVAQGALVANGTALAPIIFDSANDVPGLTPNPGDWGGVLVGPGGGTSSLNFVEILYGAGLTISGSSPTVQAFTANQNIPWGLGLSNGAALTTTAALLGGNIIGAEQLDTATLTIQSSVIQNNATNAWAAGSVTMAATSNYWGTTAQTSIAALLAGNVNYGSFLTYEPLLTPALGTSNGLAQVGGTSVLLELACRTAVSMRLSEDFTFPGVFFSPFASYTVFPLSTGGGTKHIFAQFRSVTGATNTPIELDVNYITAGPNIQAFSLANGQTLNRPLTVTGSATATLGMQDIEFYLDGVGLATNTSGSFSYYFDIRKFNNAVHQAELLARDNSGNIATLLADVIVSVTPPPAPAITSPSFDYLTNNATTTITGTAEPGISVQVTDNGQVLGLTTAGANGVFGITNAVLTEGVNSLLAVATDSTGTTPSSARHITVETIPPAAVVLNQPVYTPGSGLKLSWQFATTGKQASTFELFWGNSAFATTNQASAHSIPLYTLSDNLQGLANGTYYFGVVGFDAAGNPSPLSTLVSTVYNSTPPALSISYGAPSPVGPGPMTITLSSSEAVVATPTLTIQPVGVSPILLSLTNVAVNIWQTIYNVTAATPSGTASVQSAAQDSFGNVFSGSPAGVPLVIDTTAPTGVIVTAPVGPVQTISPTNVNISLVLSKLAQAGTTPTLNFQAPIGTHVAIPLSGAGSNWNGTLSLTPAMGSGFGKFTLSAEDSVGNVGTNIISDNQLELYNTALPSAPADPLGLSAISLPGGYIQLSWNAVSNAQIYRLYRETGTNFTMPGTLDIDNITNSTVTDQPTNDGFYAYAVSASRLDAESGFASALIAVSDRTPPPAPTNVAVALAASGVQVSWQQPAGEIPNHYNVYRNGQLINTISSAGPIVDYPPKGTNIYVVDSSDAIGNLNPSAPATNILLVAPVVSLSVVVTQGQAVALSWISTDPSAIGFDVFRNGILQNSSPLAGTNYTDSLPLSDAVTYAVTAVNASAQQSPPRLVNVYPVAIGLVVNPTNHPILINYFDQYQATITNASSVATLPLAQLILNRSVNGVSPLAATQAILTVVGAGASVQPTVIVPEAAAAAFQTVRISVFQQTDSEGSSVVYNNSFSFTNVQLPGVEIAVTASQVPLAGGLSTIQAHINNPSSVPIEVIASRSNGSKPGDLYIDVLNGFGQVVSQTPYQGTPAGTTFLADGRGYVQINPGASLSIAVPNVLVPAALAGSTNTTFLAVVTNIYCQIGTANEVGSGPLSGSMVSSSLAVPPYNGTAQTDQSVYNNDQPIVITGQAISTSTGLPVPGVSLNIGFSTRGYTWFQPVTTDTNGNYQYTYNPAPGFAGTLSIWAANPLVVDQLNQASVTVYRAYSNPDSGDVVMSKNGTVNFNIQLLNPGNVPLTSFAVGCSVYQVAGTNLTPITTITGTSVTPAGFTIAPNQSQTVTLQLAAALNAPSAAEAVFTFTSAEGAVATLTTTISLLPAVPVINVLQPAAGYVDVNVNRGDQISSQITIVNSGLTTLKGITITPPTNVAWMQLNLPVSSNGVIHLPDLPQGQSNTFTAVFSPPVTTPLAQYQDDLVINGTNLTQPYQINLYAIVTSDETGSAQFQVEDFLGDYLAGASVRLQNSLIQASAGPFMTDSNGLVTITNLEEGVWNWQASAPGCSSASGTITITADQTVYQNPVLVRSLVTINFTVVPVPFTDQYEIQVDQTFSTFVPVPELVMSPPYTSFNATPGFQATLNVTAQNAGLIKISDISITGQQTSEATLTPLITYLPVLLPQQTVDIPFAVTYTGPTAPGQQSVSDCAPGGDANLLGAFAAGLAALAQGSGDCPSSGIAIKVAGDVAIAFAAYQAITGAIAAPLEQIASTIGCLFGQLLANGGSSSGSGGGGGKAEEGQIVVPEGGGCFVAETPVLLADGTSKPIAEVRTNDLVRSGSRADNVATVSAVCILKARTLEQIDFTNAAGASRLLATVEHFFWVDGQGWTSGAELRPGEWLFDANDHRVQISGIKMITKETKVYTLKLSGAASFYANNVLVHDLCGSPPSIQTAGREVAP